MLLSDLVDDNAHGNEFELVILGEIEPFLFEDKDEDDEGDELNEEDDDEEEDETDETDPW